MPGVKRDNNQKKGERTATAKQQNPKIMVVLIVLILVVVVAGIFLFNYALTEASESAKNAYQNALDAQKQEAYECFYNAGYRIAEEKYHVENNVTISVENVKEEAQLEVLQVSDVEYVHDEENNTKIWTAILGHGVYTVDLSLAEYLVDNERQYVLVRVPEPQLNIAGLDYQYENYLFEDGVFNGSTKKGVDRAMGDLKTAQNQLLVKLTTTQTYYENAEKSAKMMIENLVKNLNPDVANLIVDVEFVD